MIQRRMSLEIKVGLFLVSGIGLLVFFLFAIGDLGTYFQPGYALRVVFDSANGIGRGSPVQYAGVEVGKVENVDIIYPSQQLAPQVELSIKVPRRIKLRTDDEAAISTFGLLGEKYLEITPGPALGQVLQPGDMLIGKPTVSTEQVIERSSQVLSELKRTLEGLNTIVGDPEARLYLKETLMEARDATRNWKLLGQRFNMAFSHAEEGQGTLGKLLFDETLYQQMEIFVQDIRQHPWKLLSRPKKSDKQ